MLVIVINQPDETPDPHETPVPPFFQHPEHGGEGKLRSINCSLGQNLSERPGL